MKLSTGTRTIEGGGYRPTGSNFTIKTTRKAFQVLSSKLYKNKIAAIIRELCCNAYDAHVVSGKTDTPIEVQLPNAFDPIFRVRDYGPGMNDVEMETVFASFFASTKEESNAYIGALGLGAKAPFSLVDAFTVYSFYGGKRNTYQLIIDDGIPMIIPLASVPSNEPSGIEVIVPIKSEDCLRFKTEAQAIFRWFDTIPKVTGQEIEPQSNTDMVGKNWGLTNVGGLTAVMGQVAYPVATNIVPSYLRNIVMFFDIGELDIQAGREELSYDDMTIATLTARLEQVGRDIRKEYEKYFTNIDNVYDARRLMLNKPHKLGNIVAPLFRGESLSPNGGIFGSGIVAEYYGLKDADERNKLLAADLHFFIHDVDRQGKKRFAYWRKENGNPDTVAVSAKYMTREKIELVKKLLGNQKIFLSSEVKLPTSRALLRKFGNTAPRFCREVQVDLNEGGYYILTKSLEFLLPDGKTKDSDYIRPLLNIMSEEVSPDVYLIPSSRKKEIEGGDWVNAIEALKKVYDKKCEDRAFRKLIKLALDYRDFSTYCNKLNYSSLFSVPFKNSEMCKLRDHWNAAKKSHTENYAWMMFSLILNEEPTSELRDAFDRVIDKLPLLRVCFKDGKPLDNIAKDDMALYVDTKLSQE